VTTESELASAFRADEARLYAEYGFAPTERFVHVAGTDVRIVSIPGSARRTPVLLLHGIASVTAAAIPLIPAFDGAPVIAVDWPGHGLSGPYRFGPRSDLRGFATEVISAATEGLESFDVVAHSLGGQFALYFAAEHPGRIRRLVLPGVPGAAFENLSAPLGMRLAAIPGLGRALIRPVSLEQYRANSAMTLGAGAVDPWPPELVSVGWYASRRAAFAETLPGLFRSIASVLGVRRSAALSPAELARVETPTLLLLGSDDVFGAPERSRASWSRMPAAELVEVAGGHAPWLNSPHECAAAVREFLGRR
jgi:pimeloyl-ACP methyl ester carboxylesterase